MVPIKNNTNQPKDNIKYPELEINLDKIEHNAKYIVDKCAEKKISICGIVKGVNAIPEVAESLAKAGCIEIGDSRLHHLKELKIAGIKTPLLLTRIPMISEVKDLIMYVDISLNSEIKVIEAINKEAELNNTKHKVILMLDLGDLREGIIDDEEFVNTASYIESNLKNIILYGIGTNLGCYGSIKPNTVNLGKLVKIAESIESKINRKIDVISGGASTSLPLVLTDEMPEGINHLRIGECILLARDLHFLWGINLDYLHRDTLLLNAEIVELKTKPSYPIGEIFLDAFGGKPHYDDIGIRKRAILAVGKQDFVFHDKLIPIDKNIKIVGSSSDHLILDIEDCTNDYSVGQIISFEMFYAPMLYLSGSNSVSKRLCRNT